jgi:nitrate reductase (NAD(P)H)
MLLSLDKYLIEMANITKSLTSEATYPLELFSIKSPIATTKEIFVPELPEIPLPPPSNAPTKVLSIDRDTPDHHVPRDPRLIRLTGVHPFNTEAPLTALFNEGA